MLSPKSARPKLIAALRLKTTVEHQRLEETAKRFGVLSSLDSFATHLQILSTHHRALLRALEPVEPFAELLTERVEELTRDLHVLGRRASTPEIGFEFPGFDRVARALGATYVTEGARLGGSAIARALRANGIDPSELCSVRRLPGRWQHVLGLLSEVPADQHRDVIAAAEWTFGSLRRGYELVVDGEAEPLLSGAHV